MSDPNLRALGKPNSYVYGLKCAGAFIRNAGSRIRQGTGYARESRGLDLLLDNQTRDGLSVRLSEATNAQPAARWVIPASSPVGCRARDTEYRSFGQDGQPEEAREEHDGTRVRYRSLREERKAHLGIIAVKPVQSSAVRATGATSCPCSFVEVLDG